MMQSILKNTLPQYNLGLVPRTLLSKTKVDSKINEITDVYEFSNFIIECEKIYDLQLRDLLFYEESH
jgi:hypothetical protein